MNNEITDSLNASDTRTVMIPGVGERSVTGTQHHWLVLEECEQNGWTAERIAELAWEDAQEQSLDFEWVFLGLLAYIQADGRSKLGADLSEADVLPQLPTSHPAARA